MKYSYKKIFLYDIYLLIVLLINSFFMLFLKDYTMILFLFITLIIFNIVFVFEKSRSRYVNDVFLDVLINLLLFFLIYYLFGLITGFYRIDNYFNFNGLFKFIIPITFTIVLKEFLRFQIFNKFEENLVLFIVTITVFVFIDISAAIYYTNFKSIQNVFVLLALTILPAISNNIFLTYISKNVGCFVCIFYLLVMNLYQYLIPIIPNYNRYLVSVINFLLPIIFLLNIKRFFRKKKDDDVVSRQNTFGRYGAYVVTSSIIFILIYFNSGYFAHVSIAVASDSMYPVIKKGDVVIIKKVNKEEKIDPNNIIAYKYSDVIIVHRVEKIKTVDGEYYYYTKGDANVLADDWIVDKNSIIGKVVFRIPYIGIPTIWLRKI